VRELAADLGAEAGAVGGAVLLDREGEDPEADGEPTPAPASSPILPPAELPMKPPSDASSADGNTPNRTATKVHSATSGEASARNGASSRSVAGRRISSCEGGAALSVPGSIGGPVP